MRLNIGIKPEGRSLTGITRPVRWLKPEARRAEGFDNKRNGRGIPVKDRPEGFIPIIVQGYYTYIAPDYFKKRNFIFRVNIFAIFWSFSMMKSTFEFILGEIQRLKISNLRASFGL